MQRKKLTSDSNLEKLTLELRRGVIILAVLSKLCEEQYGYALIQLLSKQGFKVEQGLYIPCGVVWKIKVC